MPVVSVPVLQEGKFSSKEKLLGLVGESNYISFDHINKMREYCNKNGLDAERQCRETDTSTKMEGLYIKVEEGGYVVERLKYVRVSFVQGILDSGTHWLDRPIIPNLLSVPVEQLFLE